jgi:hypothetical protein
MSQEGTRKQHESQEPREDENPNRTPRKNSQEDNRNAGKERNNPSNNPSGNPQRRQERSGTPHHDRDQQQNSRDTTNREGGQTRNHTNPSHEDNKTPDSEKARRSQTEDRPAR